MTEPMAETGASGVTGTATGPWAGLPLLRIVAAKREPELILRFKSPATIDTCLERKQTP